VSTPNENLRDDLLCILGFTTLGGVRWPNVVLAQRHAVDWQAERTPLPATGERGGSSSPVEVAERLEDRRVSSQAQRDERALSELLPAFRAELQLAKYLGVTPELLKVSERLAQVVARCTQVVDATKLPQKEPGCVSCARQGKVGKQRYPGHDEVPVYEKAKKHGLCRWCYDHMRAEGKFPPIDVIDIYHRQGPRAAGLELAKRVAARERKKAS
jgi:hypothetical protein